MGPGSRSWTFFRVSPFLLKKRVIDYNETVKRETYLFLPKLTIAQAPYAPRSIRDMKQIYRLIHFDLGGHGYPLGTRLSSRGSENTGPSPCHAGVTEFA